MISINCQCFRQSDSACLHAAAPRKWIGMPQCVLVAIPADARLRGCAIQYPFKKPDGYPLPPPSVLRREGSFAHRLSPPRSASIEPDTTWPRA